MARLGVGELRRANTRQPVMCVCGTMRARVCGDLFLIEQAYLACLGAAVTTAAATTTTSTTAVILAPPLDNDLILIEFFKPQAQ